METATLEKFKFIVLSYLTKELVTEIVNAPKVDAMLDGVFGCGGQPILRVVFEVMGCDLEQVEAKWPADWWQAFKERWFPEWATKRWPVVYKEVHLLARELYPRMQIPDRSDGRICLNYSESTTRKVKCPHCGHKNLARAGVCAFCDEYLD